MMIKAENRYISHFVLVIALHAQNKHSQGKTKIKYIFMNYDSRVDSMIASRARFDVFSARFMLR